MPANFVRCQRRGGRIRIVTPKEGVTIPVCYPKGGGSPVHGEVKHSNKKEGVK